MKKRTNPQKTPKTHPHKHPPKPKQPNPHQKNPTNHQKKKKKKKRKQKQKQPARDGQEEGTTVQMIRGQQGSTLCPKVTRRKVEEKAAGKRLENP